MANLPNTKMPDDEKLRELILHICRRSEGDPKFGATKLNKLLFYADFLAYRQLGVPITGHSYQRLPNGPAPRSIVPFLRSMEARGDIARSEHDYFGKKQIKAVALRDADLSRFTGAEIGLVDSIIGDCWGKTAKQISDMSHRFIGWMLAEDGETIPYSVALTRFGKPTENDMEIGRSMADELRALSEECRSNAG
ncbi:MAG TPA: Panacea domain-containing protein [Pirellulales bacterium]|nr:Panacea domain-containing protein [Pirellulales bacterium]